MNFRYSYDQIEFMMIREAKKVYQNNMYTVPPAGGTVLSTDLFKFAPDKPPQSISIISPNNGANLIGKMPVEIHPNVDGLEHLNKILDEHNYNIRYDTAHTYTFDGIAQIVLATLFDYEFSVIASIYGRDIKIPLDRNMIGCIAPNRDENFIYIPYIWDLQDPDEV